MSTTREGLAGAGRVETGRFETGRFETGRFESGRFERLERNAEDDVEAAIARVEAVARVMDSMIAIPGTKIRVGMDALIGLVPVLGDLVSQAISSYIIWEARQLGVSRLTMARMIGNTAIDTIVGFIPFAGDAFDVMFRANMKNLALLKAHIAKTGHIRRPPGGDTVIEGKATRID